MPIILKNTPETMAFLDLLWEFVLEDNAAGRFYSTPTTPEEEAMNVLIDDAYSRRAESADRELPAAERIDEMKRMARETRALGRKQRRAKRVTDGARPI